MGSRSFLLRPAVPPQVMKNLFLHNLFLLNRSRDWIESVIRYEGMLELLWVIRTTTIPRLTGDGPLVVDG